MGSVAFLVAYTGLVVKLKIHQKFVRMARRVTNAINIRWSIKRMTILPTSHRPLWHISQADWHAAWEIQYITNDYKALPVFFGAFLVLLFISVCFESSLQQTCPLLYFY